MFFYLAGRARRAVLGNVNPELVNAYCCVRNQVEMLIRHLWDHQRRPNPDYYQVRQGQPPRSPVECAVRLIHLNKTYYNSLYRYVQVSLAFYDA